ncbi:hypothetical protein [Rhizobium mongolense]|uniref:Uncharacterized protein n=1 Tax=Rhizobium mongolense TaxID=57676 RepID=A0A7W6RM37_9HYPH|nr:hypothetical protein [Rhizobium mongolense]MBB4274305.1 hypothetical protein [Rhizobium mongolense]
MPLETNQVKGLALIPAGWNGAGAGAPEYAVEIVEEENCHAKDERRFAAQSTCRRNTSRGVLKPVQLEADAVAVSPDRTDDIVDGECEMTSDVGILLTRCFGLSEGFFMGLENELVFMERRRRPVA